MRQGRFYQCFPTPKSLQLLFAIMYLLLLLVLVLTSSSVVFASAKPVQKGWADTLTLHVLPAGTIGGLMGMLASSAITIVAAACGCHNFKEITKDVISVVLLIVVGIGEFFAASKMAQLSTDAVSEWVDHLSAHAVSSALILSLLLVPVCTCDASDCYGSTPPDERDIRGIAEDRSGSWWLASE
ncbi:hypothetical protein PFISCL1PPCAC_26212 [Pristionchus fissidentatus]|uniref:Uncharacterized protein n=1 Tax=Pristionchus fissidentatus TaxID=1538716 RepID=A0AAV5WW87_9BILA|nr:hypothetical protein PFISCL1PPCAC_26212 [Pristionchus fissidentatus]